MFTLENAGASSRVISERYHVRWMFFGIGDAAYYQSEVCAGRETEFGVPALESCPWMWCVMFHDVIVGLLNDMTVL